VVGLVIVSHSAKLAAGVAELARAVAAPGVRIAATGGLSQPDEALGTDAQQVLAAIEHAYSDDGVVVLMDLGSAVLSAEMAVDQLDSARRARVALCDAPLVEGAVAAAVQAGLGSTLQQVVDEARKALAPKTSQLRPSGAPDGAAVPDQGGLSARPAADPEAGLRLVVQNRLGLHARPAAQFVQTAAGFAADIQVRNLTTGRGPVSAKSINGVATLGVRQGHEILVTAGGPEAQPALDALRALAAAGFGEVEPAVVVPAAEASPPGAATSAGIAGLPASPGIAVGPARFFHPALPPVSAHTVADPQGQWQALLAALEKTRRQIERSRDAVAGRAGTYAAAIFDAHRLFLDDEALLDPARQAIFTEHLNAAAAWQRATEQVAAAYRGLDDEYQRARAADVVDVGRRVVQNLLGGEPAAPALIEPGILVASDLTPAETAHLDPAVVQGICTALGGPTSHSAILARTLGIPAVAALGEQILAVPEGTLLVVDGDAGNVIPDPGPAIVAEYERRAAKARALHPARGPALGPALTRDGRHVEVAANIGSVADARAAVANGAEGVGLFRTEFLFLDRAKAPDEDEQFAAYRAVAQALNGRPLIIRTLDVGGDKPLPYLEMPGEDNPFLGWRAIRLCLARPEFFKVQLRAIVRIAAEFPLKVMFPMITVLEEWRSARLLLAEARADVRRRGQPVPDHVDTGIMVEVPAAALLAGAFAAEVDFFSMGTNDLAQYTFAAERGNPRVAGLADALHPVMLRLIEKVVDAAHAHGKWLGICGELAGEAAAVPLLAGLGVDELSMAPAAIPRAREAIGALDVASASALVQAAMALETPEAVRAAVHEWSERRRVRGGSP
jgi:multiphosphoryl transfer protein